MRSGSSAAAVTELDAGVLVLSMRRLASLVGYCPLYEFEDVAVAMTGGELALPGDAPRIERARRAYKLGWHVTRLPHAARIAQRAAVERRLDRRYGVFLAVFNHPHELFVLQALAGWERSRWKACFLCEAWPSRLPRYLVALLAGFDHVFVGVRGAQDEITRLTGRPSSYLPMGVDALAFDPGAGTDRVIDVCGIGRRSPVTHAALVEHARERGLFYYYDTIETNPVGQLDKQITFRVRDCREHRSLYMNLLKRSRYFIVNRAYADSPGAPAEISARMYEGSAAGTIMLGEPPDTDDFRDQFGWTDSVVRMPFDAPRVDEVIAELDADPARCARIRRDNVAHALRRHDWLYRLHAIFDTLGIPATDAMRARGAQLEARAREVLGAADAPSAPAGPARAPAV